ncbi:A24 family peptidase [Paenibacillus filicis]|uniref:A24 family peptidase n=1 Tax=Paenibacillus gyeongsangnamensis TaxID=3388067 RepID=A0ABT4QG60_9BACL|nr:A24 family peptidase [Paenibacillus filicis]MCZ8515877.1 A24 family peptidase [Paenibacillus filicis]
MTLWIMTGLLLACAFVTDVTKQRIPNRLTLPAAAAGLLVHAVMEGWSGLLFAAAGLACGFAPMFALYLARAVGAGDVKLFAAAGSILGAWYTLYAMYLSLVFAGILALLILLWRSDRGERLRHLGWTLVRLLLFRETQAWRSLSVKEGSLRFPLMWAVLPGFVYACAAEPIIGM